jgi:phosphoribosylamine-glycine ligase
MNTPKTLKDLVEIIEYNDRIQDRDNSVVLIIYKDEVKELLDDLKKHLSIMENFYIKYT